MSKISEKLKAKIRRQAKNRCGYCLLPQSLNPSLLEIEHLHATANGGTDEEENLWLACRLCNGYKNIQSEAVDYKTNQKVLIFNPRTQDWNEHFEWKNEKIVGKTPCGRATVKAVKLNNEIILPVRRKWISAGWFPPND
ncbi:MAG: HNH endonuclease [Pyrinomonadaceae bacterium]|nr:HNH endonuclease [Pyrinomonadaceae bacterium]